ncbi:protein dispatched homolog 1-like [Patiria miniata]|uniref:SSD domain-containing protein n=1 Tax=Patiria miniata TaxID=46514 RepID=A0A914A7M8_PATMI|nr:protein dispatched homolog 1-like [Patiria miniata]
MLWRGMQVDYTVKKLSVLPAPPHVCSYETRHSETSLGCSRVGTGSCPVKRTLCPLSIKWNWTVMSAMAEKGKDAESMQELGHQSDEVKSGISNTYATILTKFWYVVCIIVFAMMAAYGTIAFTLYRLPDFSDPVKGFDARGTDIAARLRSLTNMLYYSDDYLSQQVINLASISDEVVTRPQISCHYPEQQAGDKESEPGIWFAASLWDWDEQVAKVIFEGVDGKDMLSASSLKSVCYAETNLITSHPMYQSNCLCHDVGHCSSTWSLGNYVALLSNKSSCQNITDHDVDNVVTLLKQCAPVFHNRTRSELQDSDDITNIPTECTQHDYAIHTMLFFLLPSDFSESILRTETPKAEVAAIFFPLLLYEESALQTIYTDNLQRCSCSDGITELKAVDFSLKFTIFSSLLLADSIFLGIGIAVVFVLIWTYTGSLVFTTAALLNILFSLLMAYFFFTVVFARPFFPFSNVLAAVLIIGIGADDAFVFIDLWNKCKMETGGKDLVALTRETLRHATTTMFVTSFTTAAALFASVISDITAVKCFGVFAGTAILMNLVLTITLTPAIVVLDHKLTRLTCRRTSKGKKETSNHDNRSETHDSCRQRLIKIVKSFFEKTLPSFVLRLRYIWIVFFFLLGVGGAVVIFYRPGVRLPSVAENQFLILSHQFEQYDFIYKDQFAFANKNKPYVPGYVVWGVEAVDNGNLWDPDDWGTFSPRQDFVFSSPLDQQWLMDFCQDLRNQTFFKSDAPYDCFIERMEALMEQPCVVNPVTGQDASPCCGQSSFPYPSSVFDVCLSRFHDLGYIPSLRFSKDNSSLAVVTIPFTMSYRQSLSYALNDELWTSASTWVDSKVKSAPTHLRHGWFVPYTTDIGFYDLQRSLASGTIFSMLVTLGIGSVILLFAIQNIILTVNAMITITSTVFVTVGALVLLGWELNIVESTVITLSVGLSVDFTIHYGVAYRLAPHYDRKSRSRYSLATMSGAISIAAFSTFIAGALVMPATVYGYTQFGIFLMIVMTLSWAYSTFFFQSLCFTVGPQNNFGNIPCSSCCDCFGYNNGPTTPVADSRPLKQTQDVPVNDPAFARNVSTISSGRFLPIHYPDHAYLRPDLKREGYGSKASLPNGYAPGRSRLSLSSNHLRNPTLYPHNYSSASYPKRYSLDYNDNQFRHSEVHYNPVYHMR